MLHNVQVFQGFAARTKLAKDHSLFACLTEDKLTKTNLAPSSTILQLFGVADETSPDRHHVIIRKPIKDKTTEQFLATQ